MDYVVKPPKDIHSGCFVVFTTGVGFSVYSGDELYKLVAVTKHRTKRDRNVYSLFFKNGEDLYECRSTFRTIKGLPAVRKNGKRKESPKPLLPFADPRTKIIGTDN